MDEKNQQEIKTPIDVILRLTQSEIKNHAMECMRLNAIPPVMMFYILKSIALDVYEMKDERISIEFTELQKNICGIGKQKEE